MESRSKMTSRFNEFELRKIQDTCSWKGQLERTRSWKVQNEIGKIEVGKFEPKLVSSQRTWKVRGEVGKLGLQLESTTEVGK